MLWFKHPGTISDLKFEITSLDGGVPDQSAYLYELTRAGVPSRIIVIPGPCSTIHPESTALSSITAVLTGKKNSFDIICNDALNNRMNRGGEEISVSIQGEQLDTISTDVVQNIVLDNLDGSYTVEYIVANPGTYRIFNYLRDDPLGTSYNSSPKKTNARTQRTCTTA